MKPMLADTLPKLNDARFPLYASAKLDGIRCLLIDGMALSRSLKPIRNKHIQNTLRQHRIDGLDGELIIDDKDFNEIQSCVMSEDWEGDFEYCVFDAVLPNVPFSERYGYLTTTVYQSQSMNSPITILNQEYIMNLKDLVELEADLVGRKGFEGIMLRQPHSMYKFGRSTLKEGYLLKYKRFMDAEAYIIGFEELNHNANEVFKNEVGRSERSSHRIGMVAADCLGSLCVYDEKLDKEFNVGTGFTQEQREEIWNQQKNYMGRTLTYTYQELSHKGIPRFPSFKGFREADDALAL